MYKMSNQIFQNYSMDRFELSHKYLIISVDLLKNVWYELPHYEELIRKR